MEQNSKTSLTKGKFIIFRRKLQHVFVTIFKIIVITVISYILISIFFRFFNSNLFFNSFAKEHIDNKNHVKPEQTQKPSKLDKFKRITFYKRRHLTVTYKYSFKNNKKVFTSMPIITRKVEIVRNVDKFKNSPDALKTLFLVTQLMPMHISIGFLSGLVLYKITKK